VSRLIEIQPTLQRLPAELTIIAGDLLRFAASGGHVREGTAVRVLGVYTPAVLGTDGVVVAPTGAPNTIMFQALWPGRALIDVVSGDPWHSPTTSRVAVVVEPTGGPAEGGPPRP
jgi:hypothetical protein